MRWSRPIAALALLSCSLVVPVAFAETQSFAPSGDSYVQSGSPNANNGSKIMIDASDTRDGLVRFDLSAIPSGATITSATLTLVATSVGSASAVKNYGVHRVLADWAEGTVTWNTPGSAAGTHFASSPASTTAVSVVGSYTWDVAGDVTGFVGGSATNYGWRIIWSSNTSGTNKQVDFGTKENGTAANWPSLAVTYTLPSSSSAPVASAPSSSDISSSSAGSSAASSSEASPSPSTPSPTTGGGGGGKPPRRVTFSGLAYPKSTIEILRRTADDDYYKPEERTTLAEDGSFSVEYTGLTDAAEFLFALRVKDREGNDTGILAFNVPKYVEVWTVKDILVPPTLRLEQSTMTKNAVTKIAGFATPSHTVELELDGTTYGEAKADTSGFWTIAMDTTYLAYGEHSARVRQVAADGRASNFSFTRVFELSKLPSPKADLNADATVDIRDWSIFLFRWGNEDAGIRLQNDMNGDGVISIFDFSIFLQAMKM
ncbi:DNRLRE domain-containing protein [Candidatus Peregrinibacteria bacterium]|nr:DNRLRE domain-containing protein [Candidatus Peregrinibacteria bacterium]